MINPIACAVWSHRGVFLRIRSSKNADHHAKTCQKCFLKRKQKIIRLKSTLWDLIGISWWPCGIFLEKSELESGVLKILIQHFPWLFSPGMCQWCLSFRGPAEILWIKERLSLAFKKLNCTVHCLQIFGRWRCLICRRGARWQGNRLPGGPNTSQ